MADTPEKDAAAAQPQQQAQTRILAQYIRDLSFENILAQKGADGDTQPEIKVQVNLDARKRGAENQFEVITKLKVESVTKEKGTPLFVIELDYAGIFDVQGVPEDQMHPYLLIECPRLTFPFVRRIISDMSRDGGFPPLNLDTIDFVALYRAEIARRLEAEKAKSTEN